VRRLPRHSTTACLSALPALCVRFSCSVLFHPTALHCALARQIGLCIHLQLGSLLPVGTKLDVRVAPGSHHVEAPLNRCVSCTCVPSGSSVARLATSDSTPTLTCSVLNDKERIVAALEIPPVRAQLQALLPPDD
jgi:hypothetical protein